MVRVVGIAVIVLALYAGSYGALRWSGRIFPVFMSIFPSPAVVMVDMQALPMWLTTIYAPCISAELWVRPPTP
jgi:hypothetical protein